ncbi:SMP-30/gluconolactonase/LRE family protein [Flavobacterium sp.]|uniref:SMP-30/gluconolactonase/LRE family protein n=1 Tax=Flavobacterium sp. TaxID=239 RepID=UPI0025BE3F47|nr:SMP-30/gluconolactonase/LRE family protein [Flavobacterium sp.]
MKQNDFLLKHPLFKLSSIFYIILIGVIFLKSNNGFGQNNVLYGNISPNGSTVAIGTEPLYLGNNEVGYLINIGPITSTNVILSSIIFKLWNSSNSTGPNTGTWGSFRIRVREVHANVSANPGDPVTYSFIDKYDNNHTISVTNSTIPLQDYSNSNFINLTQSVSLSKYTSYLITIQQNLPSSLTPYWLQSDNFLGFSSFPGVSNQGAYIVSNSTLTPIPSVNQTLFFELLYSLPNATVNTKAVTTINYNQTITAESGGQSIAEAGSSITAKGICWSTNHNPTISNNFTNEGAGTTDYTSTLTNLLPNTTYYVRAYVTDASGTYYGAETSFSTNRAPVITSGAGSNNTSITISENTAAVTTIQATDNDVPAQNLTFSINGGADASKFTINQTTGALSLNATPDFENPTDSDANNSYIVTIQVTDNGSIPKSASQTLTVNVTNIAETPVVNAINTLNIGITGAALSATVVTNGGGGTITEKGFVYAPTTINANPIVGGAGTTKIIVTGTIANFTKAITTLTPNTSYSFKAFATNATGSGYTETINLTTNGLTAGPSISYETQILQQNVAITPITPTNTGTTIPAGTYSKVVTFAGSSEGNTNDTNPLSAKFNAPMGMVMDASRNIYFTDSYNHRIKKIDGTTGAVTQIAGQTTPTPFLASDSGSNDGTGIGNARFDQPSGMTFDGQGILYIADRGNNKIRKLVLVTGAVSTIAGGGTGSQSGYTDATGTAARFLRPTDVVFRTENGTSYLYVADAGNHCIRKINLTTNAVTTFAGSNTSGTTEGNLTSARFNNPTSLAFSSTGILYVVDRGNQKIRKIDAGTVSTFAGSGTNTTTNGTGTGASFADPYGIAIDGGDNLYITQALDGSYPSSNPGFSVSTSTNNYIRKITPSGVVINFIGSGTRGTTNNDNGLLASLSSPAHILFDTNQKYMYVSEWYGDDIRKVEITGYTVSPSLPSGLSLDSTNGTISGTPTATSIATNYAITGYNYYGSNSTNLNITIANLPTITTDAVTSIASSTAVSGGNVTSNGGITLTEKGICWSTTANPTINDNKLADPTTTTGNFTSNLTGLIPATTYYVRAYATNALGTSYGTQVTFTTLIQVPNIAYNTTNSFTLNNPITPLQVTNTGGSVNGINNYVTTIAGSGDNGFADGNGSNAIFNNPQNVAADAAGNIYVADYSNHRIRKIDTSGNVTTLAGNGTNGYLDANGANAQFNHPYGVAVDEYGNVYVTDRDNNKIRKIDPNGNVTTLAGSNLGYTDGNGVSAQFNYPQGIAVDRYRNIYITDIGNYKIRKIDTSGNVTTLAGSTGGQADGLGTNAKFSGPNGIAVDASGNVYVSDQGYNRIRKIDPTGNVTTIAGSSTGYADGIGIEAKFSTPNGIIVDNSGNVYVADTNNYKIRKIDSSGYVSTLAGSSFGFLDGSLTNAKFKGPRGLTVDATGNLYTTDYQLHKIRKITLTGYSVSPSLPAGLVLNTDGSITGTPTALSPATNYTITATNAGGSSSYTISIAVLSLPTVATSINISSSNILTPTSVSVTGNVSSEGGATVTTKGICYATHSLPTTGDTTINYTSGGLGSYSIGLTNLTPNTTYYARAYAQNTQGIAYGNQVEFTTPNVTPNISYNTSNNFTIGNAITPLQVTNTGSTVSGINGMVSTIAGNQSSPGYQDGNGSSAQFDSPTSIAFDTSGNMFIADYVNHRIRKIDTSGNVTTIAGNGEAGFADGNGTEAQFFYPACVATDASNNIYVADAGNHKIRKIDTSGNVTTVAGNGEGGFADGNAATAQFYYPYGVAVDKYGIIYVADYFNNKIRKITPTGSVSTIAGSVEGYADGYYTNAKFKNPIRVIVDTEQNLYVTDSGNNKIRKISYMGSVSTVAGSSQGYSNGNSTSAQFSTPTGVNIDVAGNIYVADYENHKIRKISPSGNVTTLTGGDQGYEDGVLTNAKFSYPYDIAFDNNGNAYVPDKDNAVIRKITLTGYSVSPALPAGLVLNSDGSISGTPTSLSPTTNYTITATNTIGSSSYTISIAVENNVNNVNLPTASAQTLCQGSKVANLTATGTNLKWYSTSTGGNALNPNTTLTSSTYYVSQTISGVESARVAVNVSISPNVGSIGSISGSTNLASNITSATYSVAPVTGATSYVWELPSGMTLLSQTGASINVNLSSSFSNGIIRVKAINACSETSTKSLRIQRSGLVPAGAFSLAISGNSILCPNSSQTYTATEISEGTYFWTIPSTTSIISGQGTRTITLASTASFISGQIKVVCTTNSASQQATYNISGATLPSIITGPSTICGLTTATYSVQQESGVTYQWNVPNGMTIVSGQNSSTIVVSIENQSTTGSISVRSLSTCGTSNRRTLDIGTIPIINSINGATTLCGAAQATIGNNGTVLNNNPLNQYTYSVAAISGVSSYQWSVPNGSTIISGQGSNSIVVNFDLTTFETGLISVQGINNCGNGLVKTLLVSSVTGNITGPTNLCPLSTATYSVPSDLGTNFEWDLPQGMTITSGNGTSSIQVTISHPINFNLNNQVSVSFQTACGGTRNFKLGVNCTDYSNLTTSFCEATNISPYEWIYANLVNGATEYRFNIYDQTGANLITTIDRTVPYFRFYGSNFSYGTTYIIKVQIKQNGSFNAEGSPCHLTLINLPTTSLKQEYCGITEVTPYQWLFANTISGATEYRFNIYDQTGANLISTIDRNVPYFRFYGSNFSYGSTYQVRIQAKQNGVYSSEGTACNVTLMNLPTTSLSQEYCGITGVTPYQWLFANAVTGATEYRFNIYDETGTNLISTIDRNVPYFRFYGSNFSYGSTYQVKIQAKQNGVYSSEGRTCNVSIQEINTRENPTLTKNEIEISLNQKFVAFPNPFKETFRINPLLNEKTEKVKYQIFDVVGKLIESNEIEPSMLIDYSFGSEYPRGVYIINIEQGDYHESLKMIKQ